MRKLKLLAAAALLATAAAALPTPAAASKSMTDLKKDGYSCGRGSAGGHLCTKKGERSWVCDNAGKCQMLRHASDLENPRNVGMSSSSTIKPVDTLSNPGGIFGTGILNGGGVLSSQGPAPMGSPAAAPAAPSAAPVIIR